MTVKRWGHNPRASSFGKPAIHPASVDLKGKAYEYVCFHISSDQEHRMFLTPLIIFWGSHAGCCNRIPITF